MRMADAAAPRLVTRRTFLGWWMASLLTATVVTGLAPILVYFWPAPPKGQKKGLVPVTLQTPLDQLQDGTATQILAPTSHPGGGGRLARRALPVHEGRR